MLSIYNGPEQAEIPARCYLSSPEDHPRGPHVASAGVHISTGFQMIYSFFKNHSSIFI